MTTDIYTKLVILLVIIYLIYSSIANYRYNSFREEGVKTIQKIYIKNITIGEFTQGFATAENNFKRAILVLPERDEAYYEIAMLYLGYINAEFDKKLSITENVNLTEDIALREAISKLEKAISLNPYNADAYLTLAWFYEQDGRREEADRLVERAEALWPEKLRVMQKTLEWAVLRRDMSKAGALIEKIYAIDPGLLQNSLNVLWRVEQDYEKIKTLIPVRRKARELFARFLKSKGMINEAGAEEEYARTLE